MLRLASLTSLLLTLSTGCQDVPQSPITPSDPIDAASGWHPLFDGKSASAWRGYGKDSFPSKGWVVRDGALIHEQGGGGGDLITRRTYGDFEFAFEWKAAPGANSGVMYGVRESKQPSYFTGPEYQIIDGAKNDPVHAAGGLYALYPAKLSLLRPAGRWNQGRIRRVGNHIEHWLNGGLVVECEIGSDDWNNRVKNSKFDAWKDFGKVPVGHLCLQDHGNEVWFRNLRARALDPVESRHGEPVVLFDGKSPGASGTDAFGAFIDGESSKDQSWQVRDGVLVGTGSPKGYLYTKQSFGDFVMRFDWRWKKGQDNPNSGVLLRMRGEKKIWPACYEAQLWHNKAGDVWKMGGLECGAPVGRDKARGRNIVREGGHEVPMGEWNSYEIICDGGLIRLRVNGEVVNEVWDCDTTAGPIGFQSEGSEIHLRNIVVTPLRAR